MDSTNAGQALVEHWNSKIGSEARPDADPGALVSVDAVSSRNAWAVGGRRPGPSLHRALERHELEARAKPRAESHQQIGQRRGQFRQQRMGGRHFGDATMTSPSP